MVAYFEQLTFLAGHIDKASINIGAQVLEIEESPIPS